RRLAELLDELNRTSALRQIGQTIELHLDVVEFLARIRRHLFIDFGKHDGGSGPCRGGDLGNADVLSDTLFDFSRHELLDTLGALSRPRRDDGDLANRDVGVLPFRHRAIGPDTPSNHADEEDPRDVAVLDEESSNAEAMPLTLDVAVHGMPFGWPTVTGFPSR